MFLSADIPHAGYLTTFGPCVSNLNFCVTDILQAKSLLESEGILPAIEIPMSTPGKERPPGYYFTAMDKLGFDLRNVMVTASAIANIEELSPGRLARGFEVIAAMLPIATTRSRPGRNESSNSPRQVLPCWQ